MFKHRSDTRACTGADKTVYSFLLIENNGWNSCATSRDTPDRYPNLLIRSFYERALRFHSWRGVLLKEIIEQSYLSIFQTFGPKGFDVFLTQKFFLNGNKNVPVLNTRFKTG